MRVLLSGANGFIGSKLVELLVKQGHPLAILTRADSNFSRIKKFLPNLIMISADFGEMENLTQKVSNFAPEIFINLAWYGVENQHRNELEQLSININNTINFLKIFETVKVKKIISLGSQAEYGPNQSKLDEATITQPTTYYGLAKLTAYQLFDFFCKQQNIDFAWLRVFSTYGPMDNPSWLIPTLVRSVLKGKSVDLTLGEQFWDFLYVTDAAAAIHAVMKSDAATGVFNLGSGTVITIREVAEKIRNLINPAVELNFGAIPYRPDQVMFLQADIQKLRDQAGWMPEINFAAGITETINWWKSNEP